MENKNTSTDIYFWVSQSRLVLVLSLNTFTWKKVELLNLSQQSWIEPPSLPV